MQQGRREKEAELLYRGNQYERGIKLYYKKMGKYPQTLDDITHDQNGIHFMRQAYKDPMSKDGAWRLIYVDSNGILTNSLLFTSLQDMVTQAAAQQHNFVWRSRRHSRARRGNTGVEQSGLQPGRFRRVWKPQRGFRVRQFGRIRQLLAEFGFRRQ